MTQMTKEIAKIIDLKARQRVLEERLEKLADNGSVDEFLACACELDTVEHRLQVQENFLEEGFQTTVKETHTVTSSIHPYIR